MSTEDTSFLDDLIDFTSIAALKDANITCEEYSQSILPSRGRGRRGPSFDTNLPFTFTQLLSSAPPPPKGRSRFLNRKHEVSIMIYKYWYAH